MLFMLGIACMVYEIDVVTDFMSIFKKTAKFDIKSV